MSEFADMWDDLILYLETDQVWVVWMLAVSALTFFGSLIAVPLLVVTMDARYFIRDSDGGVSLHPLLLLRRVMKNIFGWLLLLAGIAMLVLPGQGLLTIALGVCLVDFPGKRSVELRIVRIRNVRRSINWIRKKADRPPLVLPEP